MAAEALGTFIIVFFGCGSIRAASHQSALVDPSAIPFIFGLAVTIAIYALGHISGAHFNPAVTLAFAIGRHFPIKDVIAYWVAQIAGAVCASALLTILIQRSLSVGATVPTVGSETAIVWEIILTFVLMFVIISVATDTRAVGIMAGAAIGATVMIGAYLGGPFTGASMNPARTLGPAIMSNDYTSIWIYLVGPLIGATLAALCYEWLRIKPSQP
jgi:aquaporin NIP